MGRRVACWHTEHGRKKTARVRCRARVSGRARTACLEPCAGRGGGLSACGCPSGTGAGPGGEWPRGPPKKRAPRWSPWPTVGTRGGAVGTQRSWNLVAARRVEQSRPTTGLGGETVLTSGQRGERGEAVAWDRMGAGEAGRVNRSGPLGK